MAQATPESKLKRIRTLRYIVASRWILHGFLVVLGLVQKGIGVAEFDVGIFALIAVTYSYNLGFYLYLRRDPRKLTDRGLFIISIMQVVFDQIVYTVVLYASGGVESLSFLFYFLTIFIAIMIFNELQILALSFLTVLLYIGVIALEYQGIIPHQPRYHFDPGFYQNIGVTVHNSATVVLILVFTAFFAAFINNLIRQREAEIESERDKLMAIVNNLVDAIIMLDHRGRVVLMNPYAQRILRLQPRQFLNKYLRPQQFDIHLRPLAEFIVTATKEPVYQTTELTIKEDDEHTILQATALQVTDSEGDNIGALVILRNITKEKDLDQMKSDFISVAAHQLRTPLATLKWLFKMLLDGDGGVLSSKQQDLIAKGYSRNDEVIEIVNNLLDVSEIDDGRTPYKFMVAPLHEVLKQAISSAQVNAQRKSIAVTFEVPSDLPELKFDRQKIKMAFQNLLDNAVKYSNDNGQVMLRVRSENDEVVCEVIDHGIGMSQETQSRLFTKFFRGREAQVKDPTGSGLGLYIVRNIIEKHGGSIEFHSAVGRGTTFTIRLPMT
jgi:PAS domain S-box-containing protein